MSTKWKAMPSMSTARGMAGCAVMDDNRFVVLGGVDILSSGEMYDRRSKEWTKLPNDMPDGGRSSCATALIDNKVYLVGGFGGTNGFANANSLFALDTETLEWERLPSMKQKRSGCAAVAVGRFIYVFGGYGKNTAERYNVDTQQWEDLPSMSTIRQYCAAVAVQNKIYVIGGDDGEFVRLATVEVFDVDTQKWESPSSVNDMSIARYGCAAVVLGGRFVVVMGGKDGSNNELSSIEVLDTSTGNWTTSPHSMITPRIGHSAVVLGDSNIYVVGGYDGSNYLNSCESIPSVFIVSISNVAEDVRSPPLLNDASYGEDLLGMKEEILAVATMLGLKDLIAPYVLAILGGWGSGKSFAFHLILKHLKEIQKMNLIDPYFEENDNDNPYCGHLYYVKFDAWTFAKGNLWASLMHQILVSLNDQLHLESLLRKTDPELLLQGVSTIEIMEELTTGEFKYLEELIKEGKIKEDIKKMDIKNKNITKALIQATDNAHTSDRKDLEDFQQARKAAEESLEQKQTEKKKIIEGIIKQKTLEPTWNSIFDRSLSGVTGDMKIMLIEGYENYKVKHPTDPIPKTIEDCIATFNGLKKYVWQFRVGKVSPLWIVAFVISLVVAVAVPIIIGASQELWKAITPLLAPIAIGLSTFLKTANSFKDQLDKVQDVFTEARNKANEIQIQADMEDLEAQDNEIELAVKDINDEMKKLEDKIADSEKKISTLKEKVWLVEGDSLDQVVKERIDSGDYEKQLGVVHQAQTDLKRLSDAMFSNAKFDKNRPDDEKIFPRGDPRIVLFIDDLDRCPPNKVAETFEAVQLLVKTNLFVVVMAIDVRYVTLALEEEYKGILSADHHPSGLDYLEKIIQMGYRVPPIQTDESMKSFMRAQFTDIISEDIISEDDDDDNTSTQNDGGEGVEEAKEDNLDEASDAANPGETTNTSTPVETTNSDVQNERPVQLNNETTSSQVLTRIPRRVLGFLETEVEMLEEAALAADVTPRAGKRIANVLKTMKLNWYRRQIETGRREPNIEEKKALALLLALSASSLKPIRLGMCKLFSTIEQKRKAGNENENLLSLIHAAFGNSNGDTTTPWALARCSDEVETRLPIFKWTNKREWNEVKRELRPIRAFSLVGEYAESQKETSQL